MKTKLKTYKVNTVFSDNKIPKRFQIILALQQFLLML